jgi:hypothetical protein
MHNLFVCKPNSCSFYLGTWDYLGLNHYTANFVQQGRDSKFSLMNTGVTDIPNDNYATAASQWLKVGRQGNPEHILRTAIQCIAFNCLFYRFKLLGINLY